MIIRDLLDAVNQEKRKKEREKAAKKFAVGMGVVAAAGVTTGLLLAPKSGKEIREGMKKKAIDAVENVKETVQKKAEMIKDCAVHAEQEASNIVEDVHEKTEALKKEIKEGQHDITEEIHKTAGHIAKEINKSVK
jgi:gas vesicle protein